MTRHRTDVVSLLFGLLFLGLAAASWAGLLRADAGLDLRWIPPALLIVGGLTLLAGVTRGPADGASEGAADGTGWESPAEDG